MVVFHEFNEIYWSNNYTFIKSDTVIYVKYEATMCVNKWTKQKNGGMSIHTSKLAIAGSLGMSKESKCLDELFETVLLVNLYIKMYLIG